MATTKTIAQRIADAKMKKEQLENQLKRLLQQEKEIQRKARTHRLIELGALLESLIEEADALTIEHIKDVLLAALSSKVAIEALLKARGRQEYRGTSFIRETPMGQDIENSAMEVAPMREVRDAAMPEYTRGNGA